MLLKQLLALTAVINLLFLPHMVSSTSEDNIEADLEVEILNGVNFSVKLKVEIMNIFLEASGVTYSGVDIQDIADSNPEIMGAIKYALKNMVMQQLKKVFNGALIQPKLELPNYENGVFQDEYEIKLLPKFFDINDTINLHDLINGLIDVGGIVNYTFSLHPKEGWRIKYLFKLPSQLTYKRTTGSVKNNVITWIVDNKTGGSLGEEAKLSLLSRKPTTTGEGDVIELNFILDTSEPRDTTLIVEFNIKELDIHGYHILPRFIYNISSLPSDGIRLCVENNLLNWDKIHEDTLKPIEYRIKRVLENSSLNQTLQLMFQWDENTTKNCLEKYDIHHMDEEPPVKALLVDSKVNITIHGLPIRAIYGVINSGGRVIFNSKEINFGDKLDDIGLPYHGKLILPPNILLNGEREYSWSENQSIEGELISTQAPQYKDEEIHSTININIESMDLNLLSLFTGQTEILTGLYLEELQNWSVFHIPPPCSLPAGVNISLLNADAFRVCIEEGVFKWSEVKEFLENEAELSKIRIEEILPGLEINMRSNEEKLRESLKWSGNISDMRRDKPIKISSYTHTTYPLAFSFSLIPPSFNILPWNLTLQSIDNRDVTYRISFPRGVIISVNDTLGRAGVIKNLDDSYTVEVYFSKSEGNTRDELTIRIQPTLLYAIGLLSPCLISLVVAVILLIVIYLIHRKRRKKYPLPTETMDKGYEDQEYYVPPPPPSHSQ